MSRVVVVMGFRDQDLVFLVVLDIINTFKEKYVYKRCFASIQIWMPR